MAQHTLNPAQLAEVAEHIAFTSGIGAYDLDGFHEIAEEVGHDHDILPAGENLTDDDVADLRTLLSQATLILPVRAIG